MNEYAVFIDKEEENKIYFIIGGRPRSVTTAELRFGGERKREKEKEKEYVLWRKVVIYG